MRFWTFGNLDFDLSRSLKVKCRDVIGLPICGFLLMVNTNIGPNSARLRDIGLWNIGDLDFDLSRSLKVKCKSAIGLLIYGFLLMVNSNLWPNSAPLRDTRLWSVGDLDFDLKLADLDFYLSRSLKVKCEGVIGLPICGFLLMFNSNVGPK